FATIPNMRKKGKQPVMYLRFPRADVRHANTRNCRLKKILYSTGTCPLFQLQNSKGARAHVATTENNAGSQPLCATRAGSRRKSTRKANGYATSLPHAACMPAKANGLPVRCQRYTANAMRPEGAISNPRHDRSTR